jgi:dTDP-4-amino-4,6-dideoxygalactose transaminase
MLGMLPGIDFQQVHPDDRNSYKDFSITIDADAFGLTRDELSTALNAENIDSRKYYDPPVHRQTAYRGFADGSLSLENTEYLATNSLSLPIWTNMEHEVSAGICEAIRHIYRNAADIHKKLS